MLEPESAAPDILDLPEAGGRAIRGGVIRGGAYLAGIALTAVVVPLLTRHLGLVDFGQFVTATTVVMIVAGVTEFGLGGVGTREYALATPAERPGLLSSLLGLRTVLTLAGLLVAAVLMVIASYPGIVVVGMLISGLGLVLLNTQQTYSIAVNVELRWGISSLFDTINSLVVGLGTLLLVVLGGSLFSFFWVSVVSSAASLAAAVYYLHSRISLRLRIDVAHWKQLLRDMLPFAAAVTIGVLYPRIGLLATSLGSGPHQTGYYSTAYKVVEVIGGTGGVLVGSAFPIFARAGRDDHERLRYASGKVSDASLLVGTYITLSLVVAAPFIIHVVGPKSFAPSIPVLRLQAGAMLGGYAAAAWASTLLSLRLHRAILVSTALGLLSAIGLSALLVPSLGARGAAIASSAAELVVAAAYLAGIWRSHPKLRPSLAILPRLAGITLLALVPALILSLPSLVLWVISSTVFLSLVWWLRVVPHELIRALADGLRRIRSRVVRA